MSTMLATSYMASRDCATLLNIIYKLLPGTVVHTDEWIADGTIITLLISNVVSHSVVNQS